MQPHKYKSTGHWPWSPTVHRDDSYHPYPEHFIGKAVVITEKLDGGTTTLCNGEVYSRSVDSPATEGWFAMVKKHHTWKSNYWGSDVEVIGEDIYGVHTIEYDPIYEADTFYVFSVRVGDRVLSWADTVAFCQDHQLKVVPRVYIGEFNAVEALREFLDKSMKQSSALGGEREGFVIRLAEEFDGSALIRIKESKTEIMRNLCKYVRPNHVQTDKHWRDNWKPCKLIH